MSSPLVSIIIPVYNRAHSVSRSIESVLCQSYQPIELIIVDDGSTDELAEALTGYGNKITLVTQPNGGPSSARNNGVAHAKGEIISFLDSDDTWEPTKLERQIRLFVLGGEKVPCCVCNARNMVDGSFTKTSFDMAEVQCDMTEGFWLNPAQLIATRFLLFNQVVAIRREVFDRIGGFKEHMRLLEDHDLAFRLSLEGPWGFVSEPLVNKYDQDDGLGVQAQRNPRAHVEAWVIALRGFLIESIHEGSDVHQFILRSLKDGAIESRAVSMMEHGNAFTRFLGSSLRLSLRVRGAIRRRLPSWPRVQAVPSLVP